MEPDNLGGIIPPRKRIHYIAPRGDWLGSKLCGRINHPHKLIGLSVFLYGGLWANCGELKNKLYMLRISVSTPFLSCNPSHPAINFWVG